ncbi:tRNA (adenosine(37)-N6)-dimethylallyltransferase MiaA [Lentibacillus cibarius]|uniref:tRNA dimethylallyltransferase n=1 Tax=Lentibacillus cibarius TaxID=2583219 RepID=A0A549YKR4_9BACI|nr:tRNA (adenosine(37)-N6)-dimethylallyltransferase MiaA [Lentibacillus cibarius]TRM12472.1 tRNA (adenosine(37)-N6)-dimethylallyltransferase MiaA [Lentibacillus cibarius]
MKQTVIAIVGPTAVGKSRISVEVAKRFNGEIISGDSMQVYKGLDIGTAKITDKEKQGIPHYMIDIKQPDEGFSAADFQNYVQHYVDHIASKQKLPIIAGGSGLYIQAALFNYNFANQRRDEHVTNRLERELENKGVTELYNRLQRLDPDQAAKIHPNNHRRLIRALEIYETTGKTMSAYQQDQMSEGLYNPILIGLEMNRELLYERINERVDIMMEQGLLDEVRKLYDQGYEHFQAMRGIGYKEFLPYFKGEQTLEESIRLLKRNSRRYAKRQYTWFRNKLNVHWYTIAPSTIEETFGKISNDLAGML